MTITLTSENTDMNKRDQLISELEAGMVKSGEDPAKINYVLKPSNLDKLSDSDLAALVEKYKGISDQYEQINRNIQDYDKMREDGVKEIITAVDEATNGIVQQLADEIRAEEAAKEKMKTKQYSELDREVILNNRESLGLFLEYGKKWGLLNETSRTDKPFKSIGALDSFGYYIGHLVAAGGHAGAKDALEKMDQEMSASASDDRDYTKLKRAIINAQRNNFTTSLEAAVKNGDQEKVRKFQYELDNLKISETNLTKGKKITLFGFNAISPSLLPTWLLVIKSNKLSLKEIGQILGQSLT